MKLYKLYIKSKNEAPDYEDQVVAINEDVAADKFALRIGKRGGEDWDIETIKKHMAVDKELVEMEPGFDNTPEDVRALMEEYLEAVEGDLDIDYFQLDAMRGALHEIRTLAFHALDQLRRYEDSNWDRLERSYKKWKEEEEANS